MENLYLFEEKKSINFKVVNFFKSLSTKFLKGITVRNSGSKVLNLKSSKLFFSLIFVLLTNYLFAANKYSVATGLWSSTSTWSLTSGGTSGAAIPGTNDNIIIEGGYTVTISAANTASLTSLTVSSGATLVTAATQNLTATTITVNGILTNGSTGTISYSGTMSIGATGVYQHNIDGGAIPTASWNIGSSCQIIGISSAVPSGLTQSFYNLTWNCISQSANLSLTSFPTTISGTLYIQNTNNYSLILTGNFTVNGALNINGGCTLDMAAYTLSGTISSTSGTGTLKTQSTNTTPIPLGVNWSFIVQYNGTGAQKVIAGSYSNLTISGNHTTNSVTFINGGTISISGTFDPSGTTFTSGSFVTTNNTINFNGSSAQTIPTFTYNNLTSSSTGGRTFSSSGIITIAGTFTAGTNTYTIGTSTVQFATGTGTIPVPTVASGGNYYNIIIASGTWTLGGTMNIANNLTNNGGTFYVNNSTTYILTINGNYSQTAGTLDLNKGISGINSTYVKGNFLVTGGTTTTSGNIDNSTIAFNGSGTTSSPQTISYSTPTNNIYMNFSVENGTVVQMNSNIALSLYTGFSFMTKFTTRNGGTLNMQGYTIIDENSLGFGGNNIFYVNSGGTLITSNATGILGSTPSVNTLDSFGNIANYTYNGSSSQVFGNGLPSTVNNLTINNGNTAMALNGSQTINGTLTITSGKLAIGANTLTLNGGFVGTSSNSLQGNGSTSSLTIGGSGTIGILYFDQTTNGTTNTLQNLIINRASQTVTLGNTLQVTGTLTPTAGTLASAGYLTIISNASGTARIAAIPNGADITGNVTVQRYLPAISRRYRMLSSPNQNFTWSQLKNNMFVTGAGGATNGFDATPTASATCYTYQESTSGGRGWKAATNISNSVAAAVGTLVFVRGDRSIPAPAWYTGPTYTSQNAVTVGYTNQPINKGTYSPTITYTNTGVSGNDGWNLVGNPYPSQIDWSLLTKTNLSSFFYIYSPSTGSYVAASSGIIASGQAFFVQATVSSPSITFTEGAKSSSTTAYYFKTAPARVQITMIKDSLNSDVAWLDFNANSSKAFNTNEDALKYSNSVVNLSFYLDSVTKTQFNSVPMTTTSDTFTIAANAAAGTYTLQFAYVNTSIPSTKNISLVDLYTSNVVDLKTNSSYTFTITSTSSSQGNRFLIIITDVSSLPVTWLSFSGEKQNSDVSLNWKTATENNNNHFVVERSSDNNAFAEIGLVNAKGNSISTSAYNFTDKNIFSNDVNTLYYRIKQVDLDGKFDYSKTISINNNLKTDATKVSVFPNPANDFININISNKMLQNVTIEIVDITGKVIISSIASNSKDELTVNIQNFQSGIYFINILSNKNSISTTKFIKN